MNLKASYIINPEYEVNEVEGTLMVLEPTFSEVYVLEEIEAYILSLLDGINNVDDVKNEIKQTYSEDEIDDDVDSFLSVLFEKGIIVPNE